MRTNIQKWGNSLGVRIPKHLAEQLALQEMRKKQLATTKPDLWCVMSCKYEDVNLIAIVHACFFSESEASKAKTYMEKELPIPLNIGWYEIEKTRLSTI